MPIIRVAGSVIVTIGVCMSAAASRPVASEAGSIKDSSLGTSGRSARRSSSSEESSCANVRAACTSCSVVSDARFSSIGAALAGPRSDDPDGGEGPLEFPTFALGGSFSFVLVVSSGSGAVGAVIPEPVGYISAGPSSGG